MKKLTNGAPIIEQISGTLKTLAIPKKYMQMAGLLLGETMFFSIVQHSPKLIIKYSQKNHLGVTRPRKIIGYGGNYRLSIPSKVVFKNEAGMRWDCYEDGGDLYYIKIPNIRL